MKTFDLLNIGELADSCVGIVLFSGYRINGTNIFERV